MNPTVSKSIKLIATYSRVSTSTQEEQQTIQTQTMVFKDVAKDKGYSIIKEYIDDGWSGDSLVRPALDRLRQDAKEKLWDAVLIYDPDRLARRYSYQELVMDELREAGIEVIFVTVSAPKNSEDKILHGVRGIFAEYERAKIAERFRLGKLRKVRDGHILVSEALYGYSYIPKHDNEHGYYQVNEDEAKVVRMIFGWVADEGLTLRGVVRRLQEKGIKPRKSKRGVWSTSTLSTLLGHKAYIGEAHWGSSYAVVPENPTNHEKYRKMKKTSRKIRPEEEWYKITVPAIIDKDLFQRARSRIEDNFKLCQRNTKNEYLLAGKIWCTCGKRRAGEGPQHGKHLYYRCNDRVASFPLPRTCLEAAVNARIADKLVWDKVAQLMASPELLHKQVARWMNSQQAKIKSAVGDTAMIEKEAIKLRAQEDRYTKAYGAGLFTMEKLKEYAMPLREKITALEAQVAEAQQRKGQIATAVLPAEDEIRSFSKKAVAQLQNLSFTAKRAIVVNVIDKVVGTRELLQVNGYIPITQNNVESLPLHRHRRPPERGQIHALQRADQEERASRELSVLHDRSVGWRRGCAGRAACKSYLIFRSRPRLCRPRSNSRTSPDWSKAHPRAKGSAINSCRISARLTPSREVVRIFEDDNIIHVHGAD
jgi:site-specific DNA recombinase